MQRRLAVHKQYRDDRVDRLRKVEEGPLLLRANSHFEQRVAPGGGEAKLSYDSHRPVGVEPVWVDGEEPKRGHGC
jgi:hypothetical protein